MGRLMLWDGIIGASSMGVERGLHAWILASIPLPGLLCPGDIWRLYLLVSHDPCSKKPDAPCPWCDLGRVGDTKQALSVYVCAVVMVQPRDGLAKQTFVQLFARLAN